MTEYTPRTWQLGEACRHGSLGRQCETCQAEHERDWALAEVERLRKAYHDTGLSLCSAAAERDHLAAQLDEAREVLRYIAGLGDAGASDETRAALIVAHAREAVAAVLRGPG